MIDIYRDRIKHCYVVRLVLEELWIVPPFSEVMI
jgi:hypothetical protein